jgi:glycine/D-amino acid oxidase-like deaminating enzyme
MTVDRREFLRVATTGAGLALVGGSPAAGDPVKPLATRTPTGTARQSRDVTVIGAGSFGMWTALNLVRLGASVTVIDAYGPGNSRQTSGGETRGVRSSYGDRRHGPLWAEWAAEAIRRWIQWDEEGRERLLPQVFFNTGDLILRKEMIPYLEDTQANWDAIATPYEVLTPEEVSNRWPWIRFETLGVALFEPGAGVVRARRAIESVSTVFQEEGGEIRLGRASFGDRNGNRLERLNVEPGDGLSSSTFIFACGPWFPKVFPELMGTRLRIPIGHTFYFGVPPGDSRFVFPNMPSYGVPGCTGWPALGPDHRGFRVRTGGRPPEDPDVSDRWIDQEFHERPRKIIEDHFPALVGAPLLETRACHYEHTVDRNFIVDKHPDFDNVWLAGGGSAEGFKFGPVVGEYIARRVLGVEDDPELAEQFRLKEEEFEDEEEEQRRNP